MGRKERCPHCGSKKIMIAEDVKKCNVRKYEWSGKLREKTPKKEKVRF